MNSQSQQQKTRSQWLGMLALLFSAAAMAMAVEAMHQAANLGERIAAAPAPMKLFVRPTRPPSPINLRAIGPTDEQWNSRYPGVPRPGRNPATSTNR